MKTLLWFENILNRIGVFIVVVSVAVMSLVVGYSIIGRYIFSAAPFWPEEVSRFMMIYMAMIAAAVAFKEREHVGMQFIVDRVFPGRKKRWLVLLTDLWTLVFFGFVIVYGYKFAYQGISIVSPATQIKMVYPYAGIAVGGVFCFLQILINTFKSFFNAEESTEELV